MNTHALTLSVMAWAVTENYLQALYLIITIPLFVSEWMIQCYDIHLSIGLTER